MQRWAPVASSASRLGLATSGNDPAQVWGVQLVNRSSVAGLAFLAWDIVITLGDEIELVWCAPWTWTTPLFLFVRYFPLAVELSLLTVGTELTAQFHYTSRDCFIWQVFQGVASILLLASVDVILMTRVYALYERSRIVATILAALFVSELTVVSVSFAFSASGIVYDEICVVLFVPSVIVIYGATSIVFQIILFGLTAYKFVRAVQSGWGNVEIISLLMRDGTWAFFLIFLVMVLQGMLYAIPNHSAFTGIFFYWLLTIFSFCGYRILLNLRLLALIHSRASSLRTTLVSSDRTSTRPEQLTTHPHITVLEEVADDYMESQYFELDSLSSSSRRTRAHRPPPPTASLSWSSSQRGDNATELFERLSRTLTPPSTSGSWKGKGRAADLDDISGPPSPVIFAESLTSPVPYTPNSGSERPLLLTPLDETSSKKTRDAWRPP